jgi:hypothetical protein
MPPFEFSTPKKIQRLVGFYSWFLGSSNSSIQSTNFDGQISPEEYPAFQKFRTEQED